MTKIEWTDVTWSPVTGCSPVSAGCANCYAKRMAHRLQGTGLDKYRLGFTPTFHPGELSLPLKWKKPRDIFVCSMGDLFHESITNEQIAAVFGVIAACPQHRFQVLTKRAERMVEWFEWATEFGKAGARSACRVSASSLIGYAIESNPFGTSWPLPNIQLGVTVENQQAAEERIPLLLKCPSAVHFVSVEPMLERIWLDKLVDDELGAEWNSLGKNMINWVICGAETGPGKRVMGIAWACHIRDQCVNAGVPFFFKKDSLGNHELDGRVWEEKP